MAQAYRVSNWQKHYENAESRKYKRLGWVLQPNCFDSKGFRRLMRHPEGTTIYGAFRMIVALVSRQPRERRDGWLIDDDGALTPLDLADKTGAPEYVFTQAIEVLSGKDIGWIELCDIPESISGSLRKPTEISGLNRSEPIRTEQIRPKPVPVRSTAPGPSLPSHPQPPITGAGTGAIETRGGNGRTGPGGTHWSPREREAASTGLDKPTASPELFGQLFAKTLAYALDLSPADYATQRDAMIAEAGHFAHRANRADIALAFVDVAVEKFRWCRRNKGDPWKLTQAAWNKKRRAL